MTDTKRAPISDAPTSGIRPIDHTVVSNARISTVEELGEEDVPTRWLDALLSAVIAPFDDMGLTGPSRILDAVAFAFAPAQIALVLPEQRQVLTHGERTAKCFEDSRVQSFLTVSQERRFLILEGSIAYFAICADETVTQLNGQQIAFAHRIARCLGYQIHAIRVNAEKRERELSVELLTNQLKHAAKLAGFGELAAGVVHEINNPLTSILAHTDLLTRRLERDEQNASTVETLNKILSAAQRIRGYTRNLGVYLRADDDAVAQVHLHSVVQLSASFCEHLLEANGVELKVEERTLDLTTRGHENELTQVFVNLFTNACQAMPSQGGMIYIAGEIRANIIEITVRDNGQGIPPHVQSRIFDPFFTTKPPGIGTGLGLSIVRNIIEHHGGTIAFTSVEGVGTEFRIALPVKAG